MTSIAMILILAVLATAFIQLVLLFKNGRTVSTIEAQLNTSTADQGRVERAVREEIGTSRNESAGQSRDLREEVRASLRNGFEVTHKGVETIAEAQKSQLEGF